MANSIKINGMEELDAFRRRVIRQYNLPGTDGIQHRISREDRDKILDLVEELVTVVINMDEYSPDIRKESPF